MYITSLIKNKFEMISSFQKININQLSWYKNYKSKQEITFQKNAAKIIF